MAPTGETSVLSAPAKEEEEAGGCLRKSLAFGLQRISVGHEPHSCSTFPLSFEHSSAQKGSHNASALAMTAKSEAIMFFTQTPVSYMYNNMYM